MKAEAETKFSFELPGVDNCKVFGAWDRVEQVCHHGSERGTHGVRQRSAGTMSTQRVLPGYSLNGSSTGTL